jgi:hypothetical protein
MAKKPKSAPKKGLPEDVAAIVKEIERFLSAKDTNHRVIGRSKLGVYAFYDYDGEPIYVGQTEERLSSRIRRHLTNQRTDAVAMNVLDPFEVAEIEVWPIYPESSATGKLAQLLNSVEYTVFQKVLRESALGAVLNEKEIRKTALVKLPQSYRQRIIPDSIYETRKHPDVRIARRASTIASLARVISERKVSKGLRKTLLTQAKRLERLAAQRLNEIAGPLPVEKPGEETGESLAK